MVYHFEELEVWQDSKQLTIEIYKMLSDVHDFDFKSQIQRASVSIMNNIAEGFDRNKNDDTNRSFVYFLNVSYGSCGEVRSMLYLAEELGYIDCEKSIALRNKCIMISNKLYALIQVLQNNSKPK